ncbi:MAG: mechanosensitive ion channel [Rhizobiales bacterium]|nr:mechanosensitive ion channel [Hyphomicrobiales bacterium]
MLHEITTLSADLANLTNFIDQNLLTKSMAIELSLIAIALAIGWLISHLLFSTAEKTFTKEKHKPFTNKFSKYHKQIAEINAVLWPLISGIILWIAYKALPTYEIYIAGLLSKAIPFHVVRISSILLLAWALIRFASIFIKSPELSRTFEIITWSIAALAIIGLLFPLINTLDTIGIKSGNTNISVWRIFQVIVLLSLFFWLATVASNFIRKQLQASTKIAPSLRVLFGKISSFVLYTAAIIFALNTVGIDLTAFAVFTGALGVGLGFGLQKIISNFISGIILLLDKSLKPGDVIEVETGNGTTYGWVEKLGLRYTSVTTRDGTETLIPNETFITNPVTNWSFSNSKVRRKMPIGVAYNTDVEKAMELCIEAANSIDRVIDTPSPVCQLRGFGDSSVNLEVRFWIGDPQNGVKNVESQVNLKIWKLFQEHNIEIPFPQRDVNLRSVDGTPLEIRVKDSSVAGGQLKRN